MSDMIPTKMRHVDCPTGVAGVPFGAPDSQGVSYGQYSGPDGHGVLIAMSDGKGELKTAVMNPRKAAEFARQLLKCANQAIKKGSH